MAYNASQSYGQIRGGDQAPEAHDADTSHIEGSLRSLLMDSAPDSRTPPQKHAQPTGPPGPPGSAKSPHKRLNQKERRLLASQLAVPVNERASVSTLAAPPISGGPPVVRFPQQSSEQAWRQPQPRMSQEQQQHQPYPPRQSHNDPFHPPQHQSHYQRQSMPNVQAQNGPPSTSQQGPPQHPETTPGHKWRWTRPPARHQAPQELMPTMLGMQRAQPGMAQSGRAPSQFQQPQQWRGPSGPHAPTATQAPAFTDVQFQHQRPPPSPGRQLHQPGSAGQGQARPPTKAQSDAIIPQCEFLESLLHAIVSDVGVPEEEIRQKEAFRQEVEHICRDAIAKYEQQIGNTNFLPQSVELRCFGSTASGFATKASDMDLALLTPLSHITGDSADSPIPRVMEKALLDAGYGARLLTRTRVPIIKLCQKPPPVLRTELLKERMKWENGAKEVVEDDEEPIDDNDEDGAASPPEVIELRADVLATIDPAEASDAILTQYQQTLGSLKQKTEKRTLSLGDYYGKAKSLLHQLGGRDAGMNGNQALKPRELDILEDICEQFIRGLENISLRDKLLQTPVVQAIINRECDGTTARSLTAIHSLVDGETWLAAWQSRPLEERTTQVEQACEAHINAWNRHILSPNLKDYSANYNKAVFQFLGKIRTMPSLQLVFLHQGSGESTARYYARADAIRKELNIADDDGDTHEGNKEALSIVVSHYINGIHNSANIRPTLEALRAQSNLTLHEVATYHRVLELIRDYEKALEKNSYTSSDQPDIKAYVSLLRSAIRTPKHDKLILPLSGEFQQLIRKVASLPCPVEVVRTGDRFQSHLEFPKSGVGIQCDINFAASLALHNTALLRCYCAADPRVKPMVLFIKYWAKRRGINTPYRGTLSSYGYVLMVLHYLMNVAQPFVVPNLQHLGPKDPPPGVASEQWEAISTCEGRDVRFWRNEQEIHMLAMRGVLTPNNEKVGSLLRGFFEYYASNGFMTHVPGHRCFDWGRDVLSLRTMGGVIPKTDKGWVGAKTVRVVIEDGAPAPNLNPPPSTSTGTISEKRKPSKKPSKDAGSHAPEVKEIRHRYLFAIEDPFETEHNVARTVTHQGICSIRDELRRAWGLVRTAGRQYRPGVRLEMGLFEELEDRDREGEGKGEGLVELMREIHGGEVVNRALA